MPGSKSKRSSRRRTGSKVRKVRRVRKVRAPSAYNRYISKMTRGGHMTLTQAARKWKSHRGGSKTVKRTHRRRRHTRR